MLVFLQTQLCKILYIFIYLFSFFESKITLFKRKFIPQKNGEIIYYKQKNVVVNDYYNNENNIVDYDVQIIIETIEKKKYGKICAKMDCYDKKIIDCDKYFLNIELNVIENSVETPYVISLNTPINFYYTNSNIFIYEHLHFLMKSVHNVNITQDTIYTISIMDKDFNTINLSNENYIVFNDDFRYVIVKQLGKSGT